MFMEVNPILEQLQALIQAYPVCIPVNEVAALLHISPAGLRASIDQGRCPFGFSWKLGDRAAYKVPTITLVAWLTKGIMPIAS